MRLCLFLNLIHIRRLCWRYCEVTTALGFWAAGQLKFNKLHFPLKERNMYGNVLPTICANKLMCSSIYSQLFNFESVSENGLLNRLPQCRALNIRVSLVSMTYGLLTAWWDLSSCPGGYLPRRSCCDLNRLVEDYGSCWTYTAHIWSRKTAL